MYNEIVFLDMTVHSLRYAAYRLPSTVYRLPAKLLTYVPTDLLARPCHYR